MKLSKLKLNKKGQVMARLAQLGVAIAALTIVLVVTFLIISESESQIQNIEGVTCLNNHSTVPGGGGTSASCNATHVLQDAVSDIPGWVPIIVITVIGALMIGLVGLFSGGRF